MAGNAVAITYLSNVLCGNNPVNLYRARGGLFSAIVFQCGMNEDIDGAVTCYGPALKQPRPLDGLGNATSAGKNTVFNPRGGNSWLWVGQVSRRKDQVDPLRRSPDEKVEDILDTDPSLEDNWHRFPVKQRAWDPAPGYYISGTSVPRDPSRPEWDTRHHWDAESVDYMALTPALTGYGVNYGDYGIAIRNGLYRGFFFADWGWAPKVAECSKSLFDYHFPNYPQDDNERGVSYMVWPGSGGAVRTADHPFGTTSYDAPFGIHSALRKNIMLLNGVENPGDLPLFFSLGADLYRLKRVLRSLDKPDATYTNGDYTRLVSMLCLLGYNADESGKVQTSANSPNR
jgi:hypothetical protein